MIFGAKLTARRADSEYDTPGAWFETLILHIFAHLGKNAKHVIFARFFCVRQHAPRCSGNSDFLLLHGALGGHPDSFGKIDSPGESRRRFYYIWAVLVLGLSDFRLETNPLTYSLRYLRTYSLTS